MEHHVIFTQAASRSSRINKSTTLKWNCNLDRTALSSLALSVWTLTSDWKWWTPLYQLVNFTIFRCLSFRLLISVSVRMATARSERHAPPARRWLVCCHNTTAHWKSHPPVPSAVFCQPNVCQTNTQCTHNTTSRRGIRKGKSPVVFSVIFGVTRSIGRSFIYFFFFILRISFKRKQNCLKERSNFPQKAGRLSF